MVFSSNPLEDHMETNVKPIPDGYHTITPSIAVHDAAAALAFYQKAFGAEEVMRMGLPDGKVMHAEVRIGNSQIMIADENPQMGTKGPKAFGGSPVTFYVYVSDVEASFKRALAAGAKVSMPLEDMFWGDRAGQLQDPFGYSWMLAQRVKNLTPSEMKSAHEVFSASMAGKR